jgi:hypothetical protein
LQKFNSIISLLVLLLNFVLTVNAQQIINSDSIAKPKTTNDSLKHNSDIIPKGYSIVPLPDIRSDPYVGTRLGTYIFIYNYGDGARYPNFYSNSEIQASYSTKKVINAEIKHKHYGNRIVMYNLKYQNQKAAPFFGFNGYQTVYDKDFTDTESKQSLYPKNTYFYNIALSSINFNIEIQDTIKGTYINWLAGAYTGWYDLKSISLKNLNADYSLGEDGYISENAPDLYSLYKTWGVIDPKKTEGGKLHTQFKGEIIYDKRQRITNPFKGILSRVGVSFTPKYGPNSLGNTMGINASHTQYVTIIKKYLLFMFRIKYQGYFGGAMPFYMQEGIGGIKSAWGVHQDRALVKQWITGQFEPRLRAFGFKLFHQNFDFWGGPFFHTGYVLQEQKLSLNNVPDADRALYFNEKYSRWYSSFGHMGKMVINTNVVLGMDIAFPVNPAAGQPFSLFVGMNYSCMF